MGLCSTKELREQQKASREIDKSLEKPKSGKLEQSVLLLGPGESGKSTVLKQMSPEFEPTNQDILHIRMPTVGVTKVEVAFKNIKLTVCDCGGQRSERRKWHHLFDDTSAILFVAAISEFDQKLAEDDQMVGFEKLFWLAENSNQGQWCKRFIHSAIRSSLLAASLLHRRSRSEREGERERHLINSIALFIKSGDVAEWITLMTAVRKVMCSGFVNRMEEAMNLFWRVFGGKYFNKSSIILFLNKIDIFREKIKTVQIRDHFVKFEGDNTYETGVRFFRRQFRDGLSPSFRKRMYTHETCAISDQVQLIINTVIDTVVQENLKDTGMI
uniref:Uncharacterized protein n=1 Tax=Caenorhabditis japonica TaxID=281687 RepID=A0A8R1ILN4_CAEJA